MTDVAPRLAFTRERVAELLDAISFHFVPGSKITLLVRPEIAGKDADFVMTNDDLVAAIEALQLRHAAGPVTTP